MGSPSRARRSSPAVSPKAPLRVLRQPKIRKDQLFHDIGYEPHEGQALVHAGDAKRRILACGVRWGKTTCAAVEAVAAALSPQPYHTSYGWVVGPTYELADKVYREIVRIFLERLQHRVISHRVSDRKLVVRAVDGHLCEIRAKSADNPTSLLGEGLSWVIVDEAARLRPHIWESHLSQRLVDRDGWALLISTPRGRGWFYDAWRQKSLGWQSWNAPTAQNPIIRPEILEAERLRLPHTVYAQEYLGQFVEGAGCVFRSVRDLATIEEWSEPVHGEIYLAGLDLGRTTDYTVLTILDTSGRVVYMDRYTGVDWATQLGRIAAVASRYQASILVDSTGMGEPIYEALSERDLDVRPYQFSAPSKRRLIDSLAMMLEQRRLTLPSPRLAPELIDEMESYSYITTETGHVRTSAPEGMHDDTVISLALASWQIADAPVLSIASM